MRAAVYESFKGPVSVRQVPDPVVTDFGAVIEVKATGLCRSDWHGWHAVQSPAPRVTAQR